METPPSKNPKDKVDYLFDIDFKKYYILLTQQKRFILVFCCSAMLTSLALTYFFSEKYVTGTSIYYRPVETSVLQGKNTQAFGSPAPAPPFKVIVQTLSDIIKSDTILQPIVEKLHLNQPRERAETSWPIYAYTKFKDTIKENGMRVWSILKYGRVIKLDPTNKAIQELRKNFDLRATKESYVYVVTVKDKFPERAAILVDEVAKSLVEWLKQQDVDTATNRLQQLKKQLQGKEIHIRSLRDKQEKLLNENNLVEVFEELSKIVTNLYDIENDNIRLTAGIAQKKKTLESYAHKLQQRTAKKIHPTDLKKLESAMIFEEIELEGMLAKNAFLTKSMHDQQKRMKQILATKKHIETLDMQIEANNREYIHLKDMYLENLQVSAGDSEVEVMHAAIVPARPVQPIKIYHVGLTGIMSLFFSTGLIYLFAFFNIRIFFDSQGKKGRKN